MAPGQACWDYFCGNPGNEDPAGYAKRSPWPLSNQQDADTQRGTRGVDEGGSETGVCLSDPGRGWQSPECWASPPRVSDSGLTTEE